MKTKLYSHVIKNQTNSNTVITLLYSHVIKNHSHRHPWRSERKSIQFQPVVPPDITETVYVTKAYAQSPHLSQVWLTVKSKPRSKATTEILTYPRCECNKSSSGEGFICLTKLDDSYRFWTGRHMNERGVNKIRKQLIKACRTLCWAVYFVYNIYCVWMHSNVEFINTSECAAMKCSVI